VVVVMVAVFILAMAIIGIFAALVTLIAPAAAVLFEGVVVGWVPILRHNVTPVSMDFA
jgi:hypothetical protein